MLFVSLAGCEPSSSKPDDVSIIDGSTYSIINSDTFHDYKRSLDVRLNKRASEETLRKIALELKAQDHRSYERTFICYYLPDMKVSRGA